LRTIHANSNVRPKRTSAEFNTSSPQLRASDDGFP
jgi:hypothetical protein